MATIEKIVPQYDERDNYNPKGRDVNPMFAAEWNAAVDAVNDRMAIERLRSTAEGESIDKTILSGGEQISVSEVMQRFRSDGSCESIVRDALVRLADEQSRARAKNP